MNDKKYARQQRRQAQQPWRKYTQLPQIPDYTDDRGRHYYNYNSEAEVPDVPSSLVLEIKLPISRNKPPLEFPIIGETIRLYQQSTLYGSGTVDSMFFVPRGATGLCILTSFFYHKTI